MMYLIISGALNQFPLPEEISADALKTNASSLWTSVLISLLKKNNITGSDRASAVSYVTLGMGNPVPVRAWFAALKKQEQDDVQFTFTLDMSPEEFDRLYFDKSDEDKGQVTSKAEKKKIFTSALSGASIVCPVGRYELKKEEFIFPSVLERLIVDVENKLKKTHRKNTLTSLIASLNELQENERPGPELDGHIISTLTKHGDLAQQDHANRSGWRWGGWVMGMFNARDKAPLIFSSAFKKTTKELETKYSPTH